MHSECYAYLCRVARDLPAPAWLVEFGSRAINGRARLAFKPAHYAGIDIRPGENVDVVCDAATYTPALAPDMVLCTEVLEHAENAAAIVANAHRILAPGGVLIVTAAGPNRTPHSGIDGEALRPGEHYRSISEVDLREWLAPFALFQIESDARAGDVRAVAWKAGA